MVSVSYGLTWWLTWALESSSRKEISFVGSMFPDIFYPWVLRPALHLEGSESMWDASFHSPGTMGNFSNKLYIYVMRSAVLRLRSLRALEYVPSNLVTCLIIEIFCTATFLLTKVTQGDLQKQVWPTCNNQNWNQTIKNEKYMLNSWLYISCERPAHLFGEWCCWETVESLKKGLS